MEQGGRVDQARILQLKNNISNNKTAKKETQEHNKRQVGQADIRHDTNKRDGGGREEVIKEERKDRDGGGKEVGVQMLLDIY